jgi:hypothetical protein
MLCGKAAHGRADVALVKKGVAVHAQHLIPVVDIADSPCSVVAVQNDCRSLLQINMDDAGTGLFEETEKILLNIFQRF